MSRTIAVHVRYKSLYFSLPSSAKQQREIILKVYFKLISVSQIQFRDSFDSDKQSKGIKSVSRFVGKL